MLVAKQAAEVDVLSGGKLRLGVGVGWNPVEYEGLGKDFHTRGRVVEEQIEVLRLLWRHEVVTYQGKYHTITEAGLNPLPVRRAIPIWTGGQAEVLLRRTARLADGWLPLGLPDEQMQQAIERLRRSIREAGRDPGAVGIEARVNAVESIRRWWQSVGKALYPNSQELLIIADGGGSNGTRNRLWKRQLQHLATETGLSITVCHLPPATSKRKKIEHRLFSSISINWRGKPLTSLETMIELISHTTTKEGLTVTAIKDTHSYPTGIKVLMRRWPHSISFETLSTGSGTIPHFGGRSSTGRLVVAASPAAQGPR